MVFLKFKISICDGVSGCEKLGVEFMVFFLIIGVVLLVKGRVVFKIKILDNVLKVLIGNFNCVKVFFQEYGQVIVKSCFVGYLVSFCVDVDFEGEMVVIFVEVVEMIMVFVVEENDVLDLELEQVLMVVWVWGCIKVVEVFSGIDMLNVDEFVKLFGMIRVMVNLKCQIGLVLGLDGVKCGFCFLDWQIDVDGKLFVVFVMFYE